ncbi:hypothetical protein NYA30BAC_02249 [Halomonas sp. NYA30]|tara:strand:- start:3179 stop:3658 length:480 start_codon:yes stop_codon:yes gene_type:complete
MANKRLIGAVSAAVLTIAAGMIVPWEGTKLESYRDAVGTWTVCTGHTSSAGPDQKRTPEECDELLERDMLTALQAVDSIITTPLSNKTRAAFVSFTYNVGEGNLKSSTLARLANAGDLVGACEELSRWVYAGGQRLRGLVNRRAHEREVCLEGVSNAEK